MAISAARNGKVGGQSASWLAPRCIACALYPGAPLCSGCEHDFFPSDAVRCRRCALRLISPVAEQCGACLTEPPQFDSTATLADYAPPVSGMVAALKFSARLDLADAFARLLAARETQRPDMVIAVPLSFERERERGFNQSLEIGRVYARLTGAPLAERALLKVRHTAPQQSLARDARRSNVRNAYSVTGEIRDRIVAIVDDVMTTGSTLDEIARVLKRAGAAQVINRVVARTP
ncbi:MAG: phosphoribosyl transferase domain protein [Burkholderiaceae bacterium]|nr:phosphoribosyl transferase domain protein [Burkholderiaceae bacterium]